MKVSVERSGWHEGGWAVRLTQGNQSFTLAYDGNKRECLWMAKMLRKAFATYEKEIRAAGGTRKTRRI